MVQELLETKKDVFAQELNQVGRTNVLEHTIDTEKARPRRSRIYRLPRAHDTFIQDEIDKLLENGMIQPSQSAWSSPVVVVNKKNGSKRLCIDYRELNKVTKKDGWPIQRIDEILEGLNGAHGSLRLIFVVDIGRSQ